MNTTAPASTLDLDTVFEVLSDRRRRYALYALYRVEGGAMTIDRLAAAVDGMERGDRIDGAERRSERIAEELRERHVPRLAEAGAVEYDRRSETVRYRCRPALEEWFEHAAYKEGCHPDC